MLEKNILVTGGAGYIGSHLCKQLAEQGYQPITYDNLSSGRASLVKWGPFEYGDIIDVERLERVVTRYQPIAIMHLAAFIEPDRSMRDPGDCYRNNVSGILSLLDCAARHKIDKLVFSSTCAVYGNPQSTPIDETHPRAPFSPYGKSKMMGEDIIADYVATYPMRGVTFRYFNAAGADAQQETGYSLHAPSHLIPRVLDVALAKQDQLVIYGDRYETQDGTCIRDYIHVIDLAKAHVCALRFLEAGGDTQTFNLGIGCGFSVKQVIECAQEVTKRPIKAMIGDPRRCDPPKLIADATQAKKILDWQPQYTQLSDIISSSWAWHCQN